jgi:hypothetical protein
LAVLVALRREGSLATETSIYPYQRARDYPSRATTTCGFLISTDILDNKINEFSECKNNLLVNQDTRLSETKYPENKANMLIYLLLLTLLLITQKE